MAHEQISKSSSLLWFQKIDSFIWQCRLQTLARGLITRCFLATKVGNMRQRIAHHVHREIHTLFNTVQAYEKTHGSEQ